MASLEAMKLPGAAVMSNGEAALGRVLRSHSAKVSIPQPNAKLVDSKIAFKAKKKETKEADKGKPNGKREAVRESIVEESTVAVVKQGKRPRKTTSEKSSLVSKTEVAIEVSGLGSDVLATRIESWSVSLSTAGALTEATKHLVAADAKLKQIIEAHGAAPVWEHKGSAFSALARAIVYQQLAGRAADTIYGRLIALCGVMLDVPLFLPLQFIQDCLCPNFNHFTLESKSILLLP